MSGHPNPEGIATLRAAVIRMSEAEKQVENLNAQIAVCQKEVELQSDIYLNAREEVFKLMKEMDVHSSGNYGYEGRVAAFLSELLVPRNENEPQA